MSEDARVAELTQEIERLREALTCVAEQAERPLYRSLDVGFRHSPLTVREQIQRYEETCADIASDCRAALEPGR